MSQFAIAHDRVLRGIIKAHSLSIGDWFKVLDGAGVQKTGFLGGLAFLQDEKKLSHDEATALAWAYLNPEVVPADLAKSLPDGGPNDDFDKALAEVAAEDGPEVVRTSVSRTETRSSSSVKPAAKVARAVAKTKSAAKPARAKKPAKRPTAKAGKSGKRR